MLHEVLAEVQRRPYAAPGCHSLRIWVGLGLGLDTGVKLRSRGRVGVRGRVRGRSSYVRVRVTQRVFRRVGVRLWAGGFGLGFEFGLDIAQGQAALS